MRVEVRAQEVHRAYHSEAGFEALLTKCWPLLKHKVAEFFPSHGLTHDDLMQEARIGLWNAVLYWDEDKGQFGTFAWLCVERQIVTAIKTATRGKHRMIHDAMSLDAPPPGDPAEAELADVVASRHLGPHDRVVLDEELRDAFERMWWMSDLERSAFEMVVLQGRSYEAAARLLGCSGKSLDNAIQRARKRMSGQPLRLILSEDLALAA